MRPSLLQSVSTLQKSLGGGRDLIHSNRKQERFHKFRIKRDSCRLTNEKEAPNIMQHSRTRWAPAIKHRMRFCNRLTCLRVCQVLVFDSTKAFIHVLHETKQQKEVHVFRSRGMEDVPHAHFTTEETGQLPPHFPWKANACRQCFLEPVLVSTSEEPAVIRPKRVPLAQPPASHNGQPVPSEVQQQGLLPCPNYNRSLLCRFPPPQSTFFKLSCFLKGNGARHPKKTEGH
uniref:Uncharacterized protein n=1 Tax=Sphaerodactylus townsendi TaxID=933632 RepID=A0ACB8F7M8_9SAUR